MGTFRVKPRAKPRGSSSRGSGSQSIASTEDWSVSNSSTSSGVAAFRSAFDDMVRQQHLQQPASGSLDAHLARISGELSRIEEDKRTQEQHVDDVHVVGIPSQRQAPDPPAFKGKNKRAQQHAIVNRKKVDPPAMKSSKSRRAKSMEIKRQGTPKRKASLSPPRRWGSFFSRKNSSRSSSSKSSSNHKRKLPKQAAADDLLSAKANTDFQEKELQIPSRDDENSISSMEQTDLEGTRTDSDRFENESLEQGNSTNNNEVMQQLMELSQSNEEGGFLATSDSREDTSPSAHLTEEETANLNHADEDKDSGDDFLPEYNDSNHVSSDVATALLKLGLAKSGEEKDETASHSSVEVVDEDENSAESYVEMVDELVSCSSGEPVDDEGSRSTVESENDNSIQSRDVKDDSASVSSVEVVDTEEASRSSEKSAEHKDDDDSSSYEEWEDFQNSISTGPLEDEQPRQISDDDEDFSPNTKHVEFSLDAKKGQAETTNPQEALVHKHDTSSPPRQTADHEVAESNSQVRYLHRTMGPIVDTRRQQVPNYAIASPSSSFVPVKQQPFHHDSRMTPLEEEENPIVSSEGSSNDQQHDSTAVAKLLSDQAHSPVEEDSIEQTIPSNVVSALHDLGIVKSSQLVFDSSPRGVEDFQNDPLKQPEEKGQERKPSSLSAVERVVNLYQGGYISRTEYLALRKQAIVYDKEEGKLPTSLDDFDFSDDSAEEKLYEHNNDSAMLGTSVIPEEEEEEENDSYNRKPPAVASFSANQKPKLVGVTYKASSRTKVAKKSSRRKHYESSSVCSKGSAASSRKSMKRRLMRRKYKELRSDWELPEKESSMSNILINVIGRKKTKQKSRRSSSKERRDIMDMVGNGKRSKERGKSHRHRSSSGRQERKSSWDIVVRTHTENAIRSKSERSRKVAEFFKKTDYVRSKSHSKLYSKDITSAYEEAQAGKKVSLGEVDAEFVNNTIRGRRAGKHKSHQPLHSSERLERKHYRGSHADDVIRAKTERTRGETTMTRGENTSGDVGRQHSRSLKSALRSNPRYDPTLLAGHVVHRTGVALKNSPPSRSVDTGDDGPMSSGISMSQRTSHSANEEDMAAIQELKLQKRKQEGKFLVGGLSLEHVSNSSRGSDPALQRFLELAKRDAQHKRDRLRALKEGTDVTLLRSPGSSFKQKSMSDHPRSQELGIRHQLFEWSQMQAAGKKSKPRDSPRRQPLATQSERRRSKTKLGAWSEERKLRRDELRGSKSDRRSHRHRSSKEVKKPKKAESEHRRQRRRSSNKRSTSMQNLTQNRGERRKSRHSRSSTRSKSKQSGGGLADYLSKDRAKGKHGSVQDFIERSVATSYVSSDLRRKSQTSGGKSLAEPKVTSDILHHFTERYKTLQREQLKKMDPGLERKIYTAT